jgi:hypothetical protein|nr:MAG TPA: hypothetical protein [Caudoviricetes sp.]
MSQDNVQLTDNEMNGVYRTLSVSENEFFDEANSELFVQTCIEELFNEKFKLLPSEEIQGNSILLNKCFVELLKYCNHKAKFKRVGIIFIGFCTYFDLDVCVVYNELHEKMQTLIKHSAKCMCGAKAFRKEENKHQKHPEIRINTLFDICKKS